MVRSIGVLAMLVAAMLTPWPAGAGSTGDFYYDLTFNMGGKGFLRIVDFHYGSREQCMTGASNTRAQMAKLHPQWSLTSSSCGSALSPVYKAIAARQPSKWPYFAYKDMRQWLDGVPRDQARKYCRATAGDARYQAGVCIE